MLRRGGEDGGHDGDLASSGGGNWIPFMVGRVATGDGEVSERDGVLVSSGPSSIDGDEYEMVGVDRLFVVDE